MRRTTISRSPEHRFLTITEAVSKKKAPTGRPEKALYALLSGNTKTTVPDEIVRAFSIYSNPYKREVIEAFLLVGGTAEEINGILRVPVEVADAYAYFFFDPDVFEDELDVISYAYEYKRSEYGAELKKYAVDMGKECLKIRMGRGSYDINASRVQDNIRSTAYMMAQLVRINRGDSSLANAALRWAQVGLRASDNEENDSDGGVEQLRIALESKDETTNEEKSGIERERILH